MFRSEKNLCFYNFKLQYYKCKVTKLQLCHKLAIELTFKEHAPAFVSHMAIAFCCETPLDSGKTIKLTFIKAYTSILLHTQCQSICSSASQPLAAVSKDTVLETVSCVTSLQSAVEQQAINSLHDNHQSIRDVYNCGHDAA